MGSNYCCPCKTCQFAQMEGFPSCCTMGHHTIHCTIPNYTFTHCALHTAQCTLYNKVLSASCCTLHILHCSTAKQLCMQQCTAVERGGGAHKEAFSLLSPLTLPLLPATLLYQTSFAFHCTAASAFHIIKGHGNLMNGFTL